MATERRRTRLGPAREPSLLLTLRARPERAAALAVVFALGLAAGASAQSPAAGAVRKPKPKPATQTQPQTQSTAAKTPRVFTAADLERLRRNPPPGFNVVDMEGGSSTTIVLPQSSLRNQADAAAVVERYDEMVAQADAELAALQKERLAASNPFARGLSGRVGGPRSLKEVDAEIQKWQLRKQAAETNRDRTARRHDVDTE